MEKRITDISQLDLSKQYTYADYLLWQFSERVELIKGWVYKMTPAPRRKHQEVSMQISGIIWSYLRKNKDCKIFEAPFDVRLSKKRGGSKEIISVVQQIFALCVIKTS